MENMNHNHVTEAWVCLRENNNTIPDNVLDDMKNVLTNHINSIQEWKDVDGYENMPVGDWLVKLEKEAMFSTIHTAHVGKTLTTIGGQFAFDLPKVIAYKSIK